MRAERKTRMTSFPSILFRLLILTIFAAAAAAAALPAHCKDRGSCGNVTIPYPFGIDPGCYREGFNVNCNDTHYHPPKAFINSDMEILDISLLRGEVLVRYNHTSYVCYNGSSQTDASLNYLLFVGGPYTFSDVRNKFTAIGCSAVAYIGGSIRNSGDELSTGCIASCIGSVINGSCNGLGCCQTSIPKGLYLVYLTFGKETMLSYHNHCSYAFLASQDAYEFNSADLVGDEFFRRHKEGMSMVLDWAVDHDKFKSCKEAELNKSTYACVAENSFCYNSTNGPGYRCNCSNGYEGNPYLDHGCQDVNECNFPGKFPCYGICINTPGNYACSCKPGSSGEATTKNGCVADKLPLYLKLLIGIGAGIFFLVVVGTWVYLGMEKTKLIRAKHQFFKQNGGMVLQQQISSQGIASFKIFTKEELEKATNKFDDGRILGRGGYGTVYKGILDDNRVVAIKRSKVMDENQRKEFAKEMLILSQINHKNIVKILGCCLEVEVPMLVYEFIQNGTLFHYIHDKSRQNPVSLDARLRIAAESANALAYLHSSASPPIVHADVKSSNILLDDTYNAKVSDFGASKLAPNDENQLATLVQGTWGYLDPEYLQTCQLTVKSDVYSFGVVLLELFTAKKAIYFEASDQEQKGLAAAFIAAYEENRVADIMDSQILNQLEDMELLQDVSVLAIRCLYVKGDERPTMKQVADELERLRRYKQHPWVQGRHEEVQSLLNESADLVDIVAADSIALDSVVNYSLNKRKVLNIDEGR